MWSGYFYTAAVVPVYTGCEAGVPRTCSECSGKEINVPTWK
jgi:hypothetical protein